MKADTESIGGKPTKFDCTACTKSFKRERDHRSHYKEAHDKPVTLSCNHCQNHFYVEKRITEHHKKCHQDCSATSDGQWKDRCVSRITKARRVAYGCGICAAPFNALEDYLKHMERDHSGWRQKGHHISVDKIICGLLQQRLVADGWEVVKDPTLTYT